MSQDQVAWEDGRLVPSRFGATTRTVRFPFGERTVVEWGGTEPLTVPRHTDVRNVRSYIRAPAVAAKAGRFGPARGPVRLGRLALRALRPVGGFRAARAASRSSPRRVARAAKDAPS